MFQGLGSGQAEVEQDEGLSRSRQAPCSDLSLSCRAKSRHNAVNVRRADEHAHLRHRISRRCGSGHRHLIIVLLLNRLQFMSYLHYYFPQHSMSPQG